MSREQWLLAITLPVYIIFIVSEIYIGRKKQLNNYSFKDSLISIWLGLVGAALDYTLRFVTVGVLDWCNAHAIYQPDLLSYATALTFPNKITKVVALSGYFNQEIMPEVIVS